MRCAVFLTTHYLFIYLCNGFNCKKMKKLNQNKSAQSGKEKDQKRIERMVAQSLAQRYPLYEDGRNVVGFLQIMSKQLTERITDLLRGHSREMQGEIADSIRIYVVYQAIDLTGIKPVDNELLEIFEMYDQYKY